MLAGAAVSTVKPLAPAAELTRQLTYPGALADHHGVHDDLDQMPTLAGQAPGRDLYRLRRAQPVAAAPVG